MTNGTLRTWRKANKVSQVKLAEMLGIKQETVSKWELGKTKIPVKRVPQLSEITGIPRVLLRPDLPEVFG